MILHHNVRHIEDVTEGMHACTLLRKLVILGTDFVELIGTNLR